MIEAFLSGIVAAHTLFWSTFNASLDEQQFYPLEPIAIATSTPKPIFKKSAEECRFAKDFTNSVICRRGGKYELTSEVPNTSSRSGDVKELENPAYEPIRVVVEPHYFLAPQILSQPQPTWPTSNWSNNQRNYPSTKDEPIMKSYSSPKAEPIKIQTIHAPPPRKEKVNCVSRFVNQTVYTECE